MQDEATPKNPEPVSGLDVPLERDAFLRILIRELAGTLIRCAEKLRESREWCRALVQNASDVSTVLEADGTVRYTSPALERVLGYRPEEQAGNRVFSLVHPDDVERALGTLAEVLETPGVHPPIEFRVRHADGSWRYLEHTLNNLLDDPSVRGIVVNSRDVTERKRAEEKLQESERSLAATQRIARLGNWDYSLEHNRAYWSDELYRIFGFAPQEFAPTYRTFMRSVHPDDKRFVRRAIRKACYEGKHYDHSIEYRIVRPDGEIRTVYTQYEVIYGETSRPTRVAGTVQDITERKSLEDRLQYQALHDPLTDLPNRTLFIDRLEHALARSRRSKGRVAVLFIDLDNFKVVNDSLGHEVGDQLLVAVSGRLRACSRLEDTVARFGGDEFTVLLEDAGGVGDAARVAERIAEELQAPFVVRGREMVITASTGIALSASSQVLPEDLLRDADTALYQAKARGKARYEIFEEAMSAWAVQRLKLESELRRAIDRGEFRICYQPKVWLDSNLQEHLRFLRSRAIVAPKTITENRTITGMEALVRWEHPERGLLLPSEFIPVAEESGLIVPIGRWVLKEACRQARVWQERYACEPPLDVCVNLSTKQMQHPDLVRDVTRALEETGLVPSSLCLEITESTIMHEGGAPSVGALRELEGLGVRLAVDDFGTGYSSLAYLKGFPVSFLKIDRSFVDGLRKDPEDVVIVSAIIALAHTLGMQAIAEGVETAEQRAQLRGLGCDMAQGYYFSEPVSAEAISELLAKMFACI